MAMDEINTLRTKIKGCSDPLERKRLNDALLRSMVDAADLRLSDIAAPLINRGPLHPGFSR